MPRRARPHRRAFTLIEVMIAVTVLAILAAVVIPEMNLSTQDAKEATLRKNLHVLRMQIELYKLHHLGLPPTGLAQLAQLTTPTNAAGALGPAGLEYPFGPYVSPGIPPNPFTGANTIRRLTGPALTAASEAADAGYLYRPATGEIRADHPDYIGW